MQQLNERQQKILELISKKGPVSNSEIIAFLGSNASRFTVLRELEYLLEEKLIKKIGKGRAVKYELFLTSPMLTYIDPVEYFKKDLDERILKSVSFNDEVFNFIPNIFSNKEIELLSDINKEYIKRVEKADKTLLKKEVERLTIELSWKSSRMEGNTYSLIDTEILIKERIEAEGHIREEAVMILNHKNAIDYIFNNRDEFKSLSLFQIEKIHDLLTRGMDVKSGIRDGQVRITGTRYLPINDKAKIVDNLNKTIDIINSLKDPFSKALVAVLMISYLQPFFDGNKRTARILGNAILLANNSCPLSYRSVNEADYKKAILLFYEQNNVTFLKELFIEQFKFAVDNYF
ncbi:MAG: Fic family protein [Candidatus Paceibacterota bacterium]|jgi:Fic family protein